jgi:hypothetical protein
MSGKNPYWIEAHLPSAAIKRPRQTTSTILPGEWGCFSAVRAATACARGYEDGFSGLDVQCLDDHKVSPESAAEATIDGSFQFSRPLQNARGRLWVIRSDSISHVPFTRTRFWR